MAIVPLGNVAVMITNVEQIATWKMVQEVVVPGLFQ
jgi:hypothetical protein